MTRQVLLIGVVGAVLLTSLWLVFVVIPTLQDTGNAFLDGILHTLRVFGAINRYDRERTPFTGLGPVIQLWVLGLVVAVGSDAFLRSGAKRLVSAFAALLVPDAGTVSCLVDQHWERFSILCTTTRGTFQQRPTRVTLRQNMGSRTGSILKLDMGCGSPWVLDIRKRTLTAEALGWAGASLGIGDPMLDKAVVFQGDDNVAIRDWACEMETKRRILSLFEEYGLSSVATVTGYEGEPLLRATYDRCRPRLFAFSHIPGILEDLAILAASAESKREAQRG